MLKEGETYLFKIYKKMVFPDGEEYYLLESPFKSKHLLLLKMYFNYHFKLNENVNCKIDRINCSSRIFLEPEHPIYKINGIYEMNFVRFDCITNSKGFKKDAIIIQDKFDAEYFCVVEDDSYKYNDLSVIKYKLMRIKKGIFYIHIL